MYATPAKGSCQHQVFDNERMQPVCRLEFDTTNGRNVPWRPADKSFPLQNQLRRICKWRSYTTRLWSRSFWRQWRIWVLENKWQLHNSDSDSQMKIWKRCKLTNDNAACLCIPRKILQSTVRVAQWSHLQCTIADKQKTNIWTWTGKLWDLFSFHLNKSST